jgi:hypothetical protein
MIDVLSCERSKMRGRVGFEVVDEEARNIVMEEELRNRCEIVFRVEVSVF